MKLLSELLDIRANLIKDNQESESKTIKDNDCAFLYEFIKLHAVTAAIEIGTWLGTSAMIMAECGVEVWTCDQHKMFTYKHPKIHYYNMWSTEFLKKMKSKKIKFDMAFLDGRVMYKDASILMSLLKKKSPIILHDYISDKKGVRNYKIIKKYTGSITKHDGVGVAIRK